jgi:cytochrome c oxidase subunit II
MPLTRTGRWWPLVCATLLLATGAGACDPSSPSTLDPQGPVPDRAAGLFWFMFVISAVVVLVVTGLILIGALRRTHPSPSNPDRIPRWSTRMIVLGGVVLPVAILSLLWVLTLHDMAANSEPDRPTALTVEVVAIQWWWEVRYPEFGGLVTANEVHIPAGQPVRLLLTTKDVIHSFWVPQVMGKMDTITGRVNETWMQADRPGIYRGQCAEYCGAQHANMALYVVAHRPADFQAWVARERRAAAASTDAEAAEGREVFVSSPCAACHTIRGVSQARQIGQTFRFDQNRPFTAAYGPDLTHFGSRLSIGAGTVPNTRGNLGGWLIDAQTIKPGSRMPPIQLSGDELQALIAYLESLE